MKLSFIIGLAAVPAAALFATLPATAQGLGAGIPLNQERAKTPEEIEKQKQIEEAYKATLKKIPDGKQQNDPWGSMRSADTGGQAKPTELKPKSAAQKKTNNAAN
jgi:hypothetical protein